MENNLLIQPLHLKGKSRKIKIQKIKFVVSFYLTYSCVYTRKIFPFCPFVFILLQDSQGAFRGASPSQHPCQTVLLIRRTGTPETQ